MPISDSEKTALWSLHAVGAGIFGLAWVIVLAVTLGERSPEDQLGLSVTVSYPQWEQETPGEHHDNATSCFEQFEYVNATTNANQTKFIQCTSTAEHVESLYRLDILWLTVSILMLSSLVHMLLAMPQRMKVWDVYMNQLVAGINIFRWVDYMLVSPLAIVLVASLVGVLDVRMHVLLYFLSSVTAVFGLLGEVMGYIATNVNGALDGIYKKDDEKDVEDVGAPLRMSLKYGSRPVGALLSTRGQILTGGEKRFLQAIPLFFGLVCQVGVWFTILQTTTLAGALEDAEQPTIIFAIAVVHCVFSFTLSAVGVLQASGVKVVSCELAYLVLNLASRITLGLMVLSGLLVHDEILDSLHTSLPLAS